MSGDARVTLWFEGNANGAVDAAEDVADAVAEASGEMRDSARASAEVARGVMQATVSMEALKKVGELVTRGFRELIAGSEQLQQVQTQLGESYREVRDAIAGTIVTEREAQTVSAALSAISRELAASVRDTTTAEQDNAKQLALFVSGVAIGAIDALSAMSTGYAAVRLAVLAARAAIEGMINGVHRAALAFLELEQKAIRAVTEGLAELARMGAPALEYLFGEEVGAGLQQFAARMDGAAESSARVTAALTQQRDAAAATAASIRNEYAAALDAEAVAEDARQNRLAETRARLEAVQAQIAAGTLSTDEATPRIREYTDALADLEAEAAAAAAAEIERQKARAALANEQIANERSKLALLAEEERRAAEERHVYAQMMKQKEIERQIAQTNAIKEALAERVAAEEAAVARRISIAQREGSAVARVGVAAITAQEGAAEAFRLGIARELEARAIQWAIESAGRFAALDFAGGAAYAGAATAAAVGARALGGSPSAAGQVGAGASTTTNVTNQQTTVINATGIIDRPAIEQVARAVGQAREQGMI